MCARQNLEKPRIKWATVRVVQEEGWLERGGRIVRFVNSPSPGRRLLDGNLQRSLRVVFVSALNGRTLLTRVPSVAVVVFPSGRSAWSFRGNCFLCFESKNKGR